MRIFYKTPSILQFKFLENISKKDLQIDIQTPVGKFYYAAHTKIKLVAKENINIYFSNC